MRKLLFLLPVLLLAGCNRDNDVPDRGDISDRDKQAYINQENASYSETKHQIEQIHKQLHDEMKRDLHHHTWHNEYPASSGHVVIGEPVEIAPPQVVDSTPPVFIPPTVPTAAPQVVTPPTTGPPPAYTPNLSKKAVIVGINKYPGCPLNGCVDDASDIRSFVKSTPAQNKFQSTDDALKSYLLNSCSFTDDQIVFLTDADATTANITTSLLWLVADTKPGDIRLFWYSGHGAEYAGSDLANQPDHQNQVMCPVDFDWSPEHMLMDVQLHKMFATMPNGVIFNWGSDSCHSGDLTKEVPRKPFVKSKMYPLPPPPAVAANLAAVKAKRGISRRGIVGGELDVGFLSGCTYDETSADTQDEQGRPCGALTHYFLTTIYAAGNWPKPLTTLSATLDVTLDQMQYGQHPQSEGSRKGKGWLQP